MALHPCPGCLRHVRTDEVACPFCAAALAPATPRPLAATGRLSRAAVFASATLAACWSNPPPQQPIDPPPPVDPNPVERDVVGPPDRGPDDGGGQQWSQPPASTTATIRGHVTGAASGAPISNVRVHASGPNGVQREAVTDHNGAYVFDGLPPGEYTVRFTGQSNHPRQSPPQSYSTVKVTSGTVDVDAALIQNQPRHNPTNIPMPYGAPPARLRVV